MLGNDRQELLEIRKKVFQLAEHAANGSVEHPSSHAGALHVTNQSWVQSLRNSCKRMDDYEAEDGGFLCRDWIVQDTFRLAIALLQADASQVIGTKNSIALTRAMPKFLERCLSIPELHQMAAVHIKSHAAVLPPTIVSKRRAI